MSRSAFSCWWLSRKPSANRSLIAFAAWSSFAHASLMAVQAFGNADRTRRTGRRGCARYHRCSPDRAGSGKVGGAGISSSCVGLHSGKTPTPIPIPTRHPILKQDGYP